MFSKLFSRQVFAGEQGFDLVFIEVPEPLGAKRTDGSEQLIGIRMGTDDISVAHRRLAALWNTDAIKKEYFKPSDTHTVCGWKGTASYYTIEVNGKRNPDAAWYYPEPKDAAKPIAGYVAFWKGVAVEA